MIQGRGVAVLDTPDLDGLVGAIDRFCTGARPARRPERIGEELIQLRHGIEKLELLFSRDAAAFAATEEWENQGSVTPVDWLRHQCKMTRVAASDRVAVGEQLERIPRSAEALTDGRIGLGHLALMARTSRALVGSTGTFDEAPLLAQARDCTVGRFGHVCHHARHAQDPGGYAGDEVSAIEMRELQLTSSDDGMMYITGRLDSAGGASLRTVLEPLAQRAGADDRRDKDRRMADALVELALHVLDSGAVPGRATQRTHLQVTTPLETLLGLAGAPAAEMEFSLPISSKMLERVSCDCTVTRVLLGPDSVPVDVGRAHRVVPGATRRALNVRDRCCRWPGCDRPASWTQAHHLIHWSRGGKTDLAQLLLLCYWHHWRVHEGGWQIMRTEDDRILTIPPVHQAYRLARGPDQPVLT